MYVVWQKIKQTRVALLQWSRNSLQLIPKKIQSLRAQLQVLESTCQEDNATQETVETRNQT